MSILETKNISKIFPGVVALDDISVSFDLGKVHCIVGENGAGKSTLINCLTGVYTPEKGEILINGEVADEKSGLFNKIACVPQEIDLFPNMSVAENLFMLFERTNIKGLINKNKLAEKARPLLKKFSIDCDPNEKVINISVSQQQLLQIARAVVVVDYDVLILDEPTSSLAEDDAERLFEKINEIKGENKSIIYITHKLEEVFNIGDDITVFRNGKLITKVDKNQVDIPWTISQMTGGDLDVNKYHFSNKVSDEVVLKVENLTGEKFKNISFELRKGEILGFSGLLGAGRSELMKAIFGYFPVYSGQVEFEGKPWELGSTNYSVKNGLFYLSEDRRSQGILPYMSVRANATVNSLTRLKRGISIVSEKEKRLADDVVSEYNVKTATIETEIRFLSGGNQQKVIIGRAMKANPKVLIFDEPTKGIDVGAKDEIYKMIKKFAEEMQMGIILISSELDEVVHCSNRIICMYNGKIFGEHSDLKNKHSILTDIFGLKNNGCED